jgi:hypothetical protein
MFRRVTVIVALLSLSLVSAAPSVAQRIAKGESELHSLDYEAAADDLLAAAADESATDDERLQANLLGGIANRIVGREVEARLNFRYVLLRHPETQLPPDTPPKVTGFFALVKQEIAAERATTTTPASPAPAPPAPAPSTPQVAGPLVPWFVIGGGGVLAAAAAVVAVSCEATLESDETAKFAERNTVLDVGRGAMVLGVVGVLVAGAGGAWLAVSP